MRSPCLLAIGAILSVASIAACAKDPDYGTGTAGTSGGARPSGDGGMGGAAGSYVPPALTVTHPNPIISRGKPVFSSPANGNAVTNKAYHNGGWTIPPSATLPAWVAINLGAGPTRILVSWDDGGTYNYEDPTANYVYGLPAEYHFEVSPDDAANAVVSSNGMDGSWKTVAGSLVTGNQVRTRGQSFDFTGKSWVKMVITAAAPNESPNGIQLGEIDVHDLSATGDAMPEDTWFFMGDSITAFAYDRAAAHQPSFAEAVHTASPDFFPAMINGGLGGEKSSDGLARLTEALMLNPDYHFFVLGYGTNDAAGGQIPAATFGANLQAMITMVKAASHEPILPHIPYAGDGSHSGIPAYNAVIDTLTRTNNLQVGPDFYGHFMQHATDEFTCPPCTNRNTDNLHPNDVGLAAMNQLWADAVRAFYP